MITRRVYDDAGQLLREGLVPADVPNERGALLGYWQEADLAAARAEVEAQMAGEPLDGLELLPSLQVAVEQLEGQLEAISGRLQTVEGQRILSPGDGVRLAEDLARAQLAPETIVGELEVAQAAIRGTAAEARVDLDQLRIYVVQATDELAKLKADTASALATAIAGQQSAAAQERVKALAMLAERAKDIRGPQGDPGAPGPGIGIVSGAPNGQEATIDAIGRPAIPGDLLIDGSDDMRPAYRFDGQTWEQGPSLATVLVRDVKISSLDASQKIYPTVASSAVGGGGGSGLADPLTVSIIPKGASVAVADSSRWQAGGYDTFTSGIIHLEFIPNQGIMGGRHHFVTAAFVLLAGAPDTFQVTEFSVLGGGFNGSPAVFDVSFTGSLGAASAPGVLGIALPPGTANAARLFVTITAADPATRDFTIKGNIIWTPEAATGVQMPTQPVRKQPAWLLVS